MALSSILNWLTDARLPTTSSLRRCRFHLSCVGLTRKALDNIDEYSCADCTQKTGKGTTCEYSVARVYHSDVASATSFGIMYDWAHIAAVVLVENVIRHLSDSTRESLGCCCSWTRAYHAALYDTCCPPSA